jgi:hypothetical protein
MSLANPNWGAPRIHGELLKLGFELSQATVAKYMVRYRRPTLTDLAHLPEKPRKGPCRRRFLRRTDSIF